MFNIVHRSRFCHSDGSLLLAAGVKTLQEAKSLRMVSGDLVVWAHSGKCVNSESWLFDWERGDSRCYARQAISYDQRDAKENG